jgi:hypothetical protein
MTLANILPVDALHHRPLPADSDLVQAIVLARAQQDAVWNRQQLGNQLRSVLREYFPAAIEAFNLKDVGLASAEARVILTAAPTPAAAAKRPRLDGWDAHLRVRISAVLLVVADGWTIGGVVAGTWTVGVVVTGAWTVGVVAPAWVSAPPTVVPVAIMIPVVPPTVVPVATMIPVAPPTRTPVVVARRIGGMLRGRGGVCCL